ncbi:hypothetical protein KYJ26_07750 [Bacillus sp. MCCB 382]|uniref:hypothetical protein n=1 Tax=Bacillus sp. MCCB 382 TaxID=2860197 RepID=UPI001C597715|nr:hypothetical protein [Bacillus sp. MCCB 382]
MKKDKVKKLFDHVVDNEQSAVEFQTVWRKANKRNWTRRLFQSAGPNVAILMIILVLTPLAGFYFINSEHSSHSAQSTSKLSDGDYDISGKVYNFPNQIVIKGETGLPEGAILTIEHFMRDGQTLISKDKVTTNSDGYFQYATDRLERDKEYIVKVMLYPHLQNDSIKEQIGSKGENLKKIEKEEHIFQYHRKQDKYTGLRLMGLVNKTEDTTQQVSAEFLISEQEFEAVH